MPQRCAWWGAASTLILSDLHLGKLETIAAAGAPMPVGLLEAELARLVSACEITGARRVLVLGDFLHTGVGATDVVCDAFAAARGRMGASVEVVPGNHDRALARVAERCGVRVLAEVVEEGPFVFTHDALRLETRERRGRVIWAGHEHPAVTLRRRSERIKLPAFVVCDRGVVLPAFSQFTAGGPVRGGGRVFAIGEEVWEVGNNSDTAIERYSDTSRR
jgi:DNA ligase-associated metallophosphoesterase